jgi:hypothetical protein
MPNPEPPFNTVPHTSSLIIWGIVGLGLGYP